MKVGITYYVLFGFIPVTLLDQGMNCHFSLTSSRPCDVYKEAEEESEVMVDMFMANGSSLDEFLDQYKEKRKLAHMRRIKIDKMRELLVAKKVPTHPDRYSSHFFMKSHLLSKTVNTKVNFSFVI